jgi:hypothetical protein
MKYLSLLLMSTLLNFCNSEKKSDPVVATVSNEVKVENNTPSENELSYLVGQQWTGTFGEHSIVLKIQQVESAGNGVYSATGFNTVANNNRPIAGTLKLEGEKVRFDLKEPGDHKFDGSFRGTIYPSDDLAMRGSWTAYKGNRTIGFALENNNSNRTPLKPDRDIVADAGRASKFYPSAPCVVIAKRTYFHSTPEEYNKGKAFLIEGDRVTVDKVQRNFAYVQFYNEYSGKSTSGWLDTKDLEIIR